MLRNYTGMKNTGQMEGNQLSASEEKTSFHSTEAAFRIYDSAFKLVADNGDVFILTSSVDKMVKAL